MENLKQKIEDLIEKSLYDEAAEKFAQVINLEFKCEFLKNDKHFEDDKETRDIYTITLIRKTRKYVFQFGQSIIDSQYYQDVRFKERTYTLTGKCRTGNYSIGDIEKYNKSNGILPSLKLVKGKEPSLYSVLDCLTKYNPGTFEDFCSESCYDTDSKKAEKIYNAVKDEWMNVQALFSDDELEILQEIN